MSKAVAWCGFLLAFLAGMGFMLGIDRGVARMRPHLVNPDVWSDTDAAVPVDSHDPISGSRFAPVTLVVFSDYQCPHCKTVEENLRALREIYGDEDLRIVWKNNPLAMHPNAKPAAIAGETVFQLGGDEAFWKWNRAAFDHQSSLTPENFADWAVEAGVDRAKFTSAFEANEFAAKIEADLDEGHAVGVHGTPTAFVNGLPLVGGKPLAEYRKVIDEQIGRASELKDVPADEVYVTLSNRNKPAPKKRGAPSSSDQEPGANEIR